MFQILLCKCYQLVQHDKQLVGLILQCGAINPLQKREDDGIKRARVKPQKQRGKCEIFPVYFLYQFEEQIGCFHLSSPHTYLKYVMIHFVAFCFYIDTLTFPPQPSIKTFLRYFCVSTQVFMYKCALKNLVDGNTLLLNLPHLPYLCLWTWWIKS